MRDVVRLRAGEVHPGRAEALVAHRTHVDLQAVAQHQAGLGCAMRQHLAHVLVADDAIHHLAVRLHRDQQIEIADGVAQAPQAAGRLGSQDARYAAQEGEQRLGHGDADVAPEALRAAQVRRRRAQDLFFGFRTEAGDRSDALLLRRSVQLLDRLHVELVVQRAHALRADAGQRQQFGDRRRQLLAQSREQRAIAGGDNLAHLARQVGADPGQLVEIGALLDHRAHAAAELADHARRVAIGAHAKRIRVLDLEPVGDLAEDRRDVRVVHRHRGRLKRPDARGNCSAAAHAWADRACAPRRRSSPAVVCRRYAAIRRTRGGRPTRLRCRRRRPA